MRTPTRETLSVYVDIWQHDALKRIAERDGIPQSEQIRRALTGWIRSRGLKVPKTERRPALLSSSHRLRRFSEPALF